MLDNAGDMLVLNAYQGSVSMPKAVGHRKGKRGIAGPHADPPPIRAVPFVFEANAVASRRPRVGPGRPQGTNPRGLSIPWLACVYSFA